MTPKTTQDRIEYESENYADKYLNGQVNTHEHCIIAEGYIAGATAENERAQKLAEALEQILKQHTYYDVIELAVNALQQWNAGKEVENGA